MKYGYKGMATCDTYCSELYFVRCRAVSHFLKKETAFFLLPTSRTCSMPRQDVFGSYLSPSHVKYYLNFKTFRHFKTQRETLSNDDVNRASVL